MENSRDSTVKLLPIDAKLLWQGCILAMTVYAVMLPEYPFILNEHVLDSSHYLIMNHEGAKACIVFSEDHIPEIGIFRDFASERVELTLSDRYARSHFKNASQEIQDKAKNLLPIFDENIGEQILPLVTTGFWAENSKIYSNDSLEDWQLHSGGILDFQLMPFEDAMAFYEDYYDMDEERARIIKRVYQRKVKEMDQVITLSKEEIEAIRLTGEDNMDVCQEAFAKIGVVFKTET